MGVVVVDDDEVERVGRVVLLERGGHVVRSGTWADVAVGVLDDAVSPEVVLLAVRRDVRSWDRYDGLRRIGDLHARLGGGVRVVGMIADGFVEPLVMLRLTAVGVDEVVSLRAARSEDGLRSIVSGSDRGAAADPPVLPWWGVGRRCDPNAVLDRVLELAATDESYLRALEPGVAQKDCGLSRRRARAFRQEVTELGDLRVHGWGGGPDRDQSLPRWSEVVDFVNRCRGWSPSDADAPVA